MASLPDPMSYVCSILDDMLTDTQTEILEFEDTHPLHNSRKGNMIRERFGLKEARYYQIVTNLMLDPDVLPLFPQLVKRWMRRRDAANQRTMELARRRSDAA